MIHTRVPLGETAEFVNGAAFKPSDWTPTGLPIIRIQNLTDAGKPYNRTHRSVPPHLYVQPGDLLVSWSATLGVFEWAGPECGVLNQHIFRVVPNESRVHKPYLGHVLRVALRQMEQHLHGATMQHVNRTEFLSTPVFLPSLAEQWRIAEVLDSAEALQAKRRAAIALLDTLTESIFLDMFGDASTNPKSWPLAHAGEIADVQGGLQVGPARNALPRRVPYLRVANVYRGVLDLSEIKSLRASDAEVARTELKLDDLLIVEGHGNPNEIGRSALWDGSIAGCVHQNHLIRVRFDQDIVLPMYACRYLNSRGGRRHLIRSGKSTSGLNTINVSEVRATPIATPPLPIQLDFSQRVSAVEDVKRRQVKALHRTDALFASIQELAFRGEL